MKRLNFFPVTVAAIAIAACSTAHAAVVDDVVKVYDATGADNVDASAAGSPNDVASFTTAVADAFDAGLGGVFNFDSTAAFDNTFTANYDGGARQLNFTTSTTTQGVTTSGSFAPISGLRGRTTSTNQSSWSIAFSGSQPIVQLGFTVLSRDNVSLDVKATVTFSDSTTASLIDLISANSAASASDDLGDDNTFYGFTAPAGLSIDGLLLEGFEPGTSTAVSGGRIAIDDLGFVVIPTPAALPAGLALIAMLAVRRRRAIQ
jgi:hypothetical protein